MKSPSPRSRLIPDTKPTYLVKSGDNNIGAVVEGGHPRVGLELPNRPTTEKKWKPI